MWYISDMWQIFEWICQVDVLTTFHKQKYAILKVTGKISQLLFRLYLYCFRWKRRFSCNEWLTKELLAQKADKISGDNHWNSDSIFHTRARQGSWLILYVSVFVAPHNKKSCQCQANNCTQKNSACGPGTGHLHYLFLTIMILMRTSLLICS